LGTLAPPVTVHDLSGFHVGEPVLPAEPGLTFYKLLGPLLMYRFDCLEQHQYAGKKMRFFRRRERLTQ
jgi:hypothetical protein